MGTKAREKFDEARAQVVSELASFAGEAVYLVDGNCHDFTPDEIEAGVTLPVDYVSPDRSDEKDGYFAVNHEHYEASDVLVKEALHHRGF